MQIGELSRRSGVSVRMLRYYEREGLLRPSRRVSGYRAFSEDDLLVVRRIRALNSVGLPLKVIRKILPCARGRALQFAPCAEFQQSLREGIAELDIRMCKLAENRRMLSNLLRGS